MMTRLVLSLAALCSLAGTVIAADAPAPALPILALDPPPPPSIWKGLYVGSEIFAISRKGTKGAFGGDAFAGYDRVFPNNVVLGVQGSVGYAPNLYGHSFVRGYDFAALDARVGYAMGRLTPYLTTGLILAKANTGPGLGFSTSDSVNALLGTPGTLEAAPRVGAGVAYALTPNLSFDLGVSVGRGAAAAFP